MKLFIRPLAALFLLGAVVVGCQEPAAEQTSGAGVVTAVDATANTVSVDHAGMAHTFTAGEGVTIPTDLAVGDSVEFSATGETLTSLTEIQPVMEMPMDSTMMMTDSTMADTAMTTL